MKHTTYTRVLGLLACFLLLAAAGAFPASENRVSARQDCADESIRTRIRAALSDPGSIGFTNTSPVPNVEVEVRDRRVRLSGAIKSTGDLRVIQQIIAVLLGRDSCIRRNVSTSGLRISCTDDEIRQNVQGSLAASLPCTVLEGPGRPTATVLNGVVTLSGSVASQKMRRAAADTAESADCVTKVINNLQVTRAGDFNCSTLSDDALKARLMDAIRANASCTASGRINIDVTANGGNRVVTLTGEVLKVLKDRFLAAANRVCRSVTVRDLIREREKAGPQCSAGARLCIDIDGEPFCCFGCRACPTL